MHFDKERILGILGVTAIAAIVVTVIAWVIAEFACSKSFVGVLVSKNIELYYTHERRETDVSVDADGSVSIDTSGEDKTTATKRYSLMFYVEGKIREITVASLSASVPYIKREDLALAALNERHTAPVEYTSATVRTEYLVKTAGWMFYGKLREITPMSSIKTENF